MKLEALLAELAAEIKRPERQKKARASVEEDPADREKRQRAPENQLSVRPLHWRA
jgi:hypothetical protein